MDTNDYFIPTDNLAITIMQPNAPMPDISHLKPHIHGMAYFVEDGLANDGIHKKLSLRQCELFDDVETKDIKSAAEVLGRFFTNLDRIEGVRDSYQEFKDELKQLNEKDGVRNADRRFRAFIMEWRLFIDHFEFFVKSGAQTNHWKDEQWKNIYLNAFSRYFNDVKSAAFDNNDCYKIAYAVRNHISHAHNAVDVVNYKRKKVYIMRDKVIETLNQGKKQREALERQEENIDLEWIADESFKVIETVYEQLFNFFILDLEVIPAVNIMISANRKIEDAGINADWWAICEFGEMEWKPSETQYGILTRIADENGNPINPPETIKVPQLVPQAKMKYIPLNWSAYLGLAGLIARLHDQGLWVDLKKQYFGYEEGK